MKGFIEIQIGKYMEKMTIAELKKIAKDLGIPKYSKLKKKELISEILKRQMKALRENEKTEVKENNNEIKKEVKKNTSDLNLSAFVNKLEEKNKMVIDTIEEDDGIYDVLDIGNGKTIRLRRYTDIISEGYANVFNNGYAFIRNETLKPSSDDIYLSPHLIDKYKIKEGDLIQCIIRDNSVEGKYPGVIYIVSINNYANIPERYYDIYRDNPEKSNEPRIIRKIKNVNIKNKQNIDVESAVNYEKNDVFEKLVPIYPFKKIQMETNSFDYTGRIINLFSPIGLGQRALIVSPPKAGKTTILKNIARAIKKNDPKNEYELIILLIDERPEEVTDIARTTKGKVVSSTFDKGAANHIEIAEKTIREAKEKVVKGKNVIILLDSITRLARAYNLIVPSSGKVLSGGFDPNALAAPKQFLGAARQVENGGSLTIIATALVETGSKMDELIFEELKGTGNMEIALEREIARARIFPSINIKKTGTRREELLLTENELNFANYIRGNLPENDVESARIVRKLIERTDSNEELVHIFNDFLNDKKEEDIKSSSKISKKDLKDLFKL